MVQKWVEISEDVIQNAAPMCEKKSYIRRMRPR